MAENQINKKEKLIILRELQNVINKNVKGDIVEFGCFDGGTSIYLAKMIEKTNKKLYVYDSFEGLPVKSGYDDSPLGVQFKAGELSVSKKQFIKNIYKANVPMPVIKKAWFSNLNANDIPKKICFAFLDGDYYESIKDSFTLIENNLSKKAIIIVDDYTNDGLPGVKKAVDEWLSGYSKFNIKIENSLAILYS